jgi:DNA (cytosine-5)-methyltransferase 1
VLNAVDYGIPQNRERVFIIGFREEKDAAGFRWPAEVPLTKTLRDMLEKNVNPKYLLSDAAIKSLILKEDNLQKCKINPEIAAALQLPGNSCGAYKGANFVTTDFVISNSGQGRKYELKEIVPTLRSHDGCGHDNYVIDKKMKIHNPNAHQTYRVYDVDGISPSLTAMQGGTTSPFIQELPRGKNQGGIHENCPSITTNGWQNNNFLHWGNIRRLTPRECFRLMGYPDSFEWPVSDTQAYRQAGNSIVVDVLAAIISKTFTVKK